MTLEIFVSELKQHIKIPFVLPEQEYNRFLIVNKLEQQFSHVSYHSAVLDNIKSSSD